MNIVRWEPFPELMSLRQTMDRMPEDSFIHPSRVPGVFGQATAVPIDMCQTPNEVVIKATLPGIKPDGVDISITGDTLTINGETRVEEELKREDYIYKERRYGSFNRTLALPSSLQTDKVAADFEDGILTPTIPKAEEGKPKQIKIRAKDK